MRTIVTLLLLGLLSAPLLASDLANGQQIYRRYCASCHGNNGIATMVGAADFSRGEGLLRSDFALLDRIKAGRNACPAYLGILSEQEIFDVIAYLRSLAL